MKKLPHHIVEKNAGLIFVLIIAAISVGGLVEVLPLFSIKQTVVPLPGVRPYSPLELAGRNIYQREGCVGCHSQMIRPFRDEIERYGHYSVAAESMYDHPFLWGSKRTGPDLARIGGKYSDAWHAAHLKNPRDVVPQSVMPPYSRLLTTPLNYETIQDDLRTLEKVGVPYDADMIKNARADLKTQADPEADKTELLKRYPKAPTVDTDANGGMVTEADALTAYLQVLGTLAEFGK